ncbi:MAG: hypothetical protein HC783_13320 [Rhodobacteraceae bacterium]|nr:hypothetical protein [Paracoccaceae bacterium]
MTDRIESAREFARLIEQKCRELHARASFVADQISSGDDTTFAVAMLKDSESGVGFWVDALVKLTEGEAHRG